MNQEYAPNVVAELEHEGVRYCVLTTHGLLIAAPVVQEPEVYEVHFTPALGREGPKGEVMKPVSVKELIGKTITDVAIMDQLDEDRVKLCCSDGSKYIMGHTQQHSESVYLEEVEGNIFDILNSPVIDAREDVSNDWVGHSGHIYTTYIIATNNGAVVFKWAGTEDEDCSGDVRIRKFDTSGGV